MHDDPVGILQPQLARAHIPDHRAHAPLDVGAREIGEPGQVVYFAAGGDLRDAEPADPQAADGEAVALALEVERAATQIAAADPGDLDLFDLHRARLVQLLGGGRPWRGER